MGTGAAATRHGIYRLQFRAGRQFKEREASRRQRGGMLICYLREKQGLGRGRSGPKKTVPHHENYKGGEEVAVPVRYEIF